jgi:hypothetical protein
MAELADAADSKALPALGISPKILMFQAVKISTGKHSVPFYAGFIKL